MPIDPAEAWGLLIPFTVLVIAFWPSKEFRRKYFANLAVLDFGRRK